MIHDNSFVPKSTGSRRATAAPAHKPSHWRSHAAIAVFVAASIAIALVYARNHLSSREVVLTYVKHDAARSTTPQPAVAPATAVIAAPAVAPPANLPAKIPASPASKEAEGNVVDMTY
jgi:hypothetical protein